MFYDPQILELCSKMTHTSRTPTTRPLAEPSHGEGSGVRTPLIENTDIVICPNLNRNNKGGVGRNWERVRQESCAIAKMTARCTLWAVAEIWHFEIIQEFVRIENSAIRDPPFPKTPPCNQTWSGSDHPLQRYGHSRMLGAYGTPILGEGEVVGGQRWHH